MAPPHAPLAMKVYGAATHKAPPRAPLELVTIVFMQGLAHFPQPTGRSFLCESSDVRLAVRGLYAKDVVACGDIGDVECCRVIGP